MHLDIQCIQSELKLRHPRAAYAVRLALYVALMRSNNRSPASPLSERSLAEQPRDHHCGRTSPWCGAVKDQDPT